MSLSSSSPSSHGKTIIWEEALPVRSSSESHASTIEPPTLSTTESHPGPRARSSTSPDGRLSASFSTRLSARKTQTPPLHLDLLSAAVRVSRSPGTLPTLAESPSRKPSAPIDIPARKKAEGQVSRPTTPLTARAPQGEYFTSWHKTEPRISESLTPYYSSRAKKTSASRDPSAAQRGFAAMSPRSESSQCRPSSPLSPKMSVPLPSINSSQKARAPAQGYNVAGLPKYHPANFPSRDHSPAPPSPLSSRSVTLQPRSGRGSDAKQQLLQYRRDLINNTAKTSRSLLSSSVSSKPSPPRLNPLRSPGGLMTPLMLEGAGDYFGTSSLPAGFKEGDGREIVERQVQRKNERWKDPEARSGSVSPALSLSPTVSPAGGRG
ncbi:hypothetical protein HO133_004584 [Letharia lupina]|uniref:Uncharacterized protein n=1 Tax=Letharia lupina TaxID=560253 RepID=A0A8H6FKI9_9LECA|nr:uncharacterized protein HO133_004584 [Letharia lupina]KAF6230244.1 hypothetical protein HO133_004584 [Letharia lupina]